MGLYNLNAGYSKLGFLEEPSIGDSISSGGDVIDTITEVFAIPDHYAIKCLVRTASGNVFTWCNNGRLRRGVHANL
jgi:hypothetical protein